MTRKMEKGMKIVEMKIEDVIPYDGNPRLNEDAVDAVAESIRNYGFKVPIVVDKDNVIICGHTRRLAALKLGLENVPVIVAEDLPPEKVKAFRLDDNKTAELATWDFSKLQKELSELKEDGYNLDTLAFGEEELARLMEDSGEDASDDGVDIDGETEPDEAPDVKEEEYDSVYGGIYQLGEHRLVCGDCTEGLDISKLFEGDGANPVSLWLTDPPYNVAYAGRANKSEEDKKLKNTRNKDLTIANDNMDEKQFAEFTGRAFQNCAAFMEPGASFYVFHAFTIAHVIRQALLDSDMNISNQLIWAKNHFALGWGCYLMKHEPIWFGWKNGGNHSWYGAHDNNTTTVQNWNIVNSCDIHPTMKPVDMLKYFIRNSSKKGDIVMDTFGGSGSTLIACEQTGRVCRTMEIMPKYCDAIRKRYAEFVNGKGCDWQSLTPKTGEIIGREK